VAATQQRGVDIIRRLLCGVSRFFFVAVALVASSLFDSDLVSAQTTSPVGVVVSDVAGGLSSDHRSPFLNGASRVAMFGSFVYAFDSHVLRRVGSDGSIVDIAGHRRDASSQYVPFESIDGVGSAAEFAGAGGNIVSDSVGNIFVVESGLLRKVSPAGVVTTIAGNRLGAVGVDGNRSSATFGNIQAVAIDASDNLFFADGYDIYGQFAIRRLNAAGDVVTLTRFDSANPAIITLLGAGLGSAQIESLVIDRVGNIYLLLIYGNSAGGWSQVFLKVPPSGDVQLLGSDDGRAHPLGFTNFGPSDLVVDASSGVLLVGENKIVRYTDTSWTETPVTAGSVFDPSRLNTPTYGALARDGGLLLSSRTGALQELSVTGVVSTLVAPLGSTPVLVNGTADVARFWRPQGVAVAANGDTYVADTGNNVIRRVSVAGGVSTFAGSGVAASVDGPGAPASVDGPSTSAQFWMPNGVAVSPDGTVFVVDCGGLRKVVAGVVSTVSAATCMRPPPLPTTLARPGFFAVGGFTSQISSLPFHRFSSVVVDRAGTVFVADENQVYRVGVNGTLNPLALTGVLLGSPKGIAVGNGGTVFVADTGSNRIVKIDAGGVASVVAGDINGTGGYVDGVGLDARFGSPTGLVIDAAGNLFTADAKNHRVRKISVDGSVTTIAGSGVPGWLNGAGPIAKFDFETVTNGYPNLNPFTQPTADLAIDNTGNLFVADTGNNRIRKITFATAPADASKQSCSSTPKASPGGIKYIIVCGVQISAQPDGFLIDFNLAMSRKGGASVVAAPADHYEILAGGVLARYRNGVREDPGPQHVRFKVVNSTIPGLVATGTCRKLLCNSSPQPFGDVVATVGAVSNAGGVVTVTAYIDSNGNETLDANEVSATKSVRFRRPVAFGDSYSSGEGANDYDPYTKSLDNSCHRSKNAYPRITNIADPATTGSFSDVMLYSCSGARTYNVQSAIPKDDSKVFALNTQERDDVFLDNIGWNRQFPVMEAIPGGPNVGTAAGIEKRQFLSAAATNAARPGLPDYVTVGIGGNDMEFANFILDYCTRLGSGPCTRDAVWTPPPGETSGVYPKSIRTFGQFVDYRQASTIARVGQTLDEVKALYPGVPVFAMGYPMLFTGTNFEQDKLCQAMGGLFGASVPYFRERQFQFETASKQLAALKGVHYVSLLDAYESGNHGICGSGGPAINNLAVEAFSSLPGKVCKAGLLASLAKATPLDPIAPVVGSSLSAACLTALTVSYNGGLRTLKKLWQNPAAVADLAILASQGSFHPNGFGQTLDRDALTTYVTSWSGLRTAAGIPKISGPVPAAIAASAARAFSRTSSVADSRASSSLHPVNSRPAFENSVLTASAINTAIEKLFTQLAPKIAGQIGYFPITASCANVVGDALAISATGDIGSVPIAVRLENMATNEIVARGVLNPLPGLAEAAGTIVLPMMADGTVLRVHGDYQFENLGTPIVVATTKPVCPTADAANVVAGTTSTLDVLANDNSIAGANIGSVSQPAHGTVSVTADSKLTYLANRAFSGDDTFVYEVCARGLCSVSSVTVTVNRPICTVTSLATDEVVIGTEGNDVICVGDGTPRIDARGGDDLIIVTSGFGMVNPGSGNDTVIFDGEGIFGVTSSPGTVHVLSDAPYLRLSDGVLPTLSDPTQAELPTLDTTAPTITVNIPDLIRVNAPATATITCADASGVSSCPSSAPLDTATPGIKFLTVSATDSAANTGTLRTAYEVTDADTTAPVVVGTVSRTPDSNGWYRNPVMVTWSSTDPEPSSGTPNTPAPTTVASDGVSRVVTSAPSCDLAGNCATGSVTVSLDQTPPVITVTGNKTRYQPNETISIVCVATDATSGIKSQDCPTFTGPAASLGAGAHSYSVTAVDNAGNTTTQSFVVNVNTAPTVTCTAAPLTWTAVDQKSTCVASDAEGLVGAPTFELTTSVAAGTETLNASTGSQPVCDTDGSCVTAGPIGGFRVDKKAPTITISSPGANAQVVKGANASFTYSCADAGSGVVTTGGCIGSIPSGSLVDTSIVGSKSLQVSAVDAVGNMVTQTVSYTVVEPAPTGFAVKADFDSGVRDVAYPTLAVAVYGTFAANGATGPFTASVKWTDTATFVPFALASNTQFVGAWVYPKAGVYKATVKVCGKNNVCGTDTVTIRAGALAPTPIGQCVTDRGVSASPRFIATFGYDNPNTVPLVALKPLVNSVLPLPFDRGQPQILLPGSQRNVFSVQFAANGSVSWSLFAKSVSLKQAAQRC
jgi:sugar lactone lactonase YvrE